MVMLVVFVSTILTFYRRAKKITGKQKSTPCTVWNKKKHPCYISADDSIGTFLKKKKTSSHFFLRLHKKSTVPRCC